jgi:hypothetical protein
MVSGLPACATCFSALRPSRLAIPPNVTRSRIGKPQPHRQMASQNPILYDQVLVAQQQILIRQPRIERQEACPVESIAYGETSIITTVGQRSSFARVFWLNGSYALTPFLDRVEGTLGNIVQV